MTEEQTAYYLKRTTNFDLLQFLVTTLRMYNCQMNKQKIELNFIYLQICIAIFLFLFIKIIKFVVCIAIMTQNHIVTQASRLSQRLSSKQQLSQKQKSRLASEASIKNNLTFKSELPLSLQDQVKIRQIINKKALLYGFNELSDIKVYKKLKLVSFSKHIPHRDDKNHESNKLSLDKKSNEAISRSTPKDMKAIPLLAKNSIYERNFPRLHSFQTLISQQKEIVHIFREKLDHDLNSVVYFYLEILTLVVDYQAGIFNKKIVKQNSILIPTLQFVTQSLLQLNFIKLSLFFAASTVELCQSYKFLQKMDTFLLIIAKVLRKMFKYDQSILMLKKALQYTWLARRQRNKRQIQHTKRQVNGQKQLSQLQSIQSNYHSQPYEYSLCELQTYNELSYCLLQTNFKNQSSIFAQKYQIGYTEPQTSNIVNLSKQLISSTQKQLVEWQRLDKKRLYLVIGVDLQYYISKHQKQIKHKFYEDIFFNNIKLNFQVYLNNFYIKQLFSYQVPLPTTIIKNQYTNRKVVGPKIQAKLVIKPKPDMIKKKTSKTQNIIHNHQRVGQNRILNYRGVGLSRTKLTELLKQYVNLVKKKLGYKHKESCLTLPLLKTQKNINFNHHFSYANHANQQSTKHQERQFWTKRSTQVHKSQN